jgi:hypothetical protein
MIGGGGNIVTGQAKGGPVYAAGGTLVNFQPQGTDTVPAMLTPGEFVVQKSAVDKYGAGFMNSVNSGAFAKGGFINPIYRQNGGQTYEQRRIASQRMVYGIGPEVEDADVAKRVREIIANRQKQRTSSSKAAVDAVLGFSQSGFFGVETMRRRSSQEAVNAVLDGTIESRAEARQAARSKTESLRAAARQRLQDRQTQRFVDDPSFSRLMEIHRIMAQDGVNRRVAAKRVSLGYQRSRTPGKARSGRFLSLDSFSPEELNTFKAPAPATGFFREETLSGSSPSNADFGPGPFAKALEASKPKKSDNIIDHFKSGLERILKKPSYFQNGGGVGSTRIEGASELINASNSLKEAAATLPQTITMDLGGQSVNVNINGGELLRELMPQISNMVKTSIVNELIDFEDIQTSNSTPGAYASIKKAEQYGDRA